MITKKTTTVNKQQQKTIKTKTVLTTTNKKIQHQNKIKTNKQKKGNRKQQKN